MPMHHRGRFPPAATPPPMTPLAHHTGSPHSGWEGGEYGDGGYIPGGYQGNKNIVRIDMDDSKKKVIPLLRHFRELAVYTEDSYLRLLERMCKACDVPGFERNKPQLEFSSPEASQYERGVYICDTDKKRLCMKDVVDLRTFVVLWAMYLRSRNMGFTGTRRDPVTKTTTFPENQYAREVMKESQPKQILRLKERRFVEEIEI